MNRRLVGVVVVLTILLAGCFVRLVAEPSSLIVDADHPSLDHARPPDDPGLGNDLTRLFLPHHLSIARSLSKLGHVPLWDDRGFGGRPLVGNPQAGLFYPPVWVAWWTGSPSSLGWITIAHLLWMGLGTYRLGRTLKMGEWGSLFAAGCVQASPYVLAQTFEGHYPHVWAACWYPWAFDAAVRLRRGDLPGGVWIAPILALMLLTGHPQEGYYLLIALGFWAAFDGLAAIRSGRIHSAMGTWVAWAGLVGLAVGLTGVEMVPDALAQEWTLKGTRLSIRLAGRYHAYPINLLQLLSPRALGEPAGYFGHENYWESVVSIGLIPLFLATIGVAWSSDRRSVRGWLVLVVASLLFAFGRKFGVFPLLFELVPGMNRFRVPARSLFLAGLGASMLAGLGVEALRIRASQVPGWGRLASRASILAGVLAGMVLAGRFFLDIPSSVESELDRLSLGLSRLNSDLSFWLALGVVPIGLAIGWKIEKARPILAVSLGLLGLVELGYHGHRLIVTTPAGRYFDPDPISEALTSVLPPDRAPTRIRVVDALYDDLRAGQLGLTKTNVNDSFQIQHAADLYESLYRLFDAYKFLGNAPMDQAVANYRRVVRQSVLDRMGVSFLVDDRLAPDFQWPMIASGRWRCSTFAVYRNPTALPRAYVVPRIEPAPDDCKVLDLFQRLDPREAVLMAVDPIGPSQSVRQPFIPAEWASTDPDRLVLRVTTEAPGLLVITDTWMPGWVAEVDRKGAPIFRGNGAQRVIPLRDSGRHEIVLRYQTPGLRLGIALTVGSALVWVTGLVLSIVITRKSRKLDASDVCH